jgi:tryptophanyl-tRNA synthetase
LISGIQPSGKLHIGNYLGALKNFVELQNSGKYQCYFFIADLHSLTEDFNPKEKPKQILELMADYLAAGLTPQKSVIFLQSQIPAHSELAWVLNTITPMGELSRMTQFKDKTRAVPKDFDRLAQESFMKEFGHKPESDAEKVAVGVVSENLKDFQELIGDMFQSNIGLLDYPVLMAADILLYDTKFVPVGEDQLQHLEITRTLARKFNKKFGKTFIEPQPILTKTPRVMSLANPQKKMSKSQPESCLFIDDSPLEIKNKIRRAVTDSGSEIKYDEKNKPAISNLLEIYSSFSGETIPKLEKKFNDKNYSTFKNDLADVVTKHFANFRKKKSELMKNQSRLSSFLAAGSQKAAKVANKKIAEVRKKVGLI